MTAKPKHTYPVVIVGGGMAGASLSLALTRQGIACAVFEAFATDMPSQPSFDDRTVALSASSLNILRNLGVSDDFMSVAEPIEQIHVSEQGHIGFTRLNAKDQGMQQLGAVVENWQLGKVLHKNIKQQELIDWFAPTKVLKLEQQSDKAQLTVETADGESKVEASLVVLADGARSPLRKSLYIDSRTRDFGTSAIVCNVATQQSHHGCAYERFTADGPLAMLPLTQNRMALVWSKPNDEVETYLALSEQDFAAALERDFGARLGRITKVGKRAAFPLIQQQAETLFRGRCVLVGNAAQSLHPIAGQGFNLGLRDVAYLSQCLGGLEGDDYGAYQVLRNYEHKRHADRNKTVWMTESLARLFANAWSPMSVSRNLMLKALDITPIAKDLFAQQAMGFNFENSELAANDE